MSNKKMVLIDGGIMDSSLLTPEEEAEFNHLAAKAAAKSALTDEENGRLDDLFMKMLTPEQRATLERMNRGEPIEGAIDLDEFEALAAALKREK